MSTKYLAWFGVAVPAATEDFIVLDSFADLVRLIKKKAASAQFLLASGSRNGFEGQTVVRDFMTVVRALRCVR